MKIKSIWCFIITAVMIQSTLVYADFFAVEDNVTPSPFAPPPNPNNPHDNFSKAFSLTKYLGVETGYTSFMGTSKSAFELPLNAFSVVGKGYLPLDVPGFNFYALGGGAEVFSAAALQNNQAIFEGVTTSIFNPSAASAFQLRPVFGLGASYDFTSNLNSTFEFSRMQGGGNALPTNDTMTLNFSYSFD